MNELTDEQLYTIALEKRKNGNGTTRAYAAQRELAKRHGVIKPHSNRADGSTKRFSYQGMHRSLWASVLRRFKRRGREYLRNA
jgi:hypothetical protein